MSNWRELAACQGTGHVLFFGPEYERGPDKDRREAAARALCAGCPVSGECLDYAIAHSVRFGLWGGMDEDERKAEKQRRREAPA